VIGRGANERATPQLNDMQRSAMLDFWTVYEDHYEELQRELEKAASTDPVLQSVIHQVPQHVRDEQNRLSFELTRKALVDSEWEPWLENLQEQGGAYAAMGVSIPSWFRIVSDFRRLLRPSLRQVYANDRDRLAAAIEAMENFTDLALSEIATAYLHSREELIIQQQEAIRDLSTPVLQLRQGLLLLPIVGMMDSHRARQLTTQLLHSIRAQRAKIVVLDLTGVPTVDSAVANHLMQTVQAARLLGAKGIVTGLSAENAQTLVRLGASLSGLNTLGDLQDGIEEADRLLGYHLIRETGWVPPSNGTAGD